MLSAEQRQRWDSIVDSSRRIVRAKGQQTSSAAVLAVADHLAACEALLREVEWVEDGMTEKHCPICHAAESIPHAPDCRLAAILGSTAEEARPNKR